MQKDLVLGKPEYTLFKKGLDKVTPYSTVERYTVEKDSTCSLDRNHRDFYVKVWSESKMYKFYINRRRLEDA